MAIFFNSSITVTATDGGTEVISESVGTSDIEGDFYQRLSLRLANGASKVYEAGGVGNIIEDWGTIIGYSGVIEQGQLEITYLAAGAEPVRIVTSADGGNAVFGMMECNLTYLKLTAIGFVTGKLILFGRLA